MFVLLVAKAEGGDSAQSQKQRTRAKCEVKTGKEKRVALKKRHARVGSDGRKQRENNCLG